MQGAGGALEMAQVRDLRDAGSSPGAAKSVVLLCLNSAAEFSKSVRFLLLLLIFSPEATPEVLLSSVLPCCWSETG